MIRFALIAGFGLFLLIGAPAFAADYAAVGEKAPDFSLSSIKGDKVALSDYRGKAVVLNFWATWCPPCRSEMPSMEELNRLLAGEEFVMLAVNVEDDAQDIVEEFLTEHPHSFTVLLDGDGEVQRSYGVYRYPETFIIRPDGIIAEKVIGAINWADPKIVNFLRFLSKG